ncbi:glycoside hydrolase family 32 protein [Sphingopyxis sp. R3-92]|uniref:glycoside hydrolase family 32 protein n=1 Tax=Sphingopyxis sp. R3-92 TaxID=3158553 RepID=UPI003EE7E427
MHKTALSLNDQLSANVGDEPFRPQFHFTPRQNWMNDPNGLVYFEGEYHLFFQYNPHGIQWGHMSWGHAVSSDLVHWTELPIAMPEREFMIFSGCALVDWGNVSGLGDGKAPPLLAFYTAFDEARLNQSQHLAYSHDRGRSWTHYDGNPLIDLGIEHFRDPNVFYHSASEAWIMVVALAQRHRLQFYRSANLLEWELASEFGPAGSTAGQWECPDLIPVPVEESAGDTRWVLKVDVDKDFVAGGSGAQYFVGDFDGFHFRIDKEKASPTGELADFGPDFYAAISWSDLPSDQQLPIWIGWMSNHQCGRHYPTHPWLGSQSLPRQLFLFEEEDRLRLGQRPVAALDSLRRSSTAVAARKLLTGERLDIVPPSTAFEWSAHLDYEEGGAISIILADGETPLLTLLLDSASGQLTFERHQATNVSSAEYGRKIVTHLPRAASSDIRLLFDGSLVEIFIDDGRRVYSACIFPVGELNIACSAMKGAVQLGSLGLWAIARSIDL